jgi:hypothetical protein
MSENEIQGLKTKIGELETGLANQEKWALTWMNNAFSKINLLTNKLKDKGYLTHEEVIKLDQEYNKKKGGDYLY